MINMIIAMVLSLQASDSVITLDDAPDRNWIHTCTVPGTQLGIILASDYEIEQIDTGLRIIGVVFTDNSSRDEIVLYGDDWHCVSIRIRRDDSFSFPDE